MVARALESMVVSFSDGTKLAAFREPLTKIVEGMRASAPPLRGGASDALEFGHQVPAAAGLSLSRPQTARPGAMPNGAGLPGPGSAHASPFSSRNSSTWSLAQSSRAPSRNGGYMTPGGSNGRAVSTGSNPQHRQQQAAGMSLSRPGTAFAPPRDYYQYHQAPPRRALKYEADNTNSEVTTTGPPIMLTERSVTAWSEQVAQFYAVIRGFVDRHAAEPMGAGPDKVRALVESGAWAVLARVYKPMHQGDAASYLEVHLREPCSKRCLVTRVIVDFVVNSVWVPAAWRGSGPQADRALAELQEELDRTKGLPGVDRQPALDRQAAVIDGIMGLHDITSVYAAWAGAAPPDPFHKAKLEGLAGTLLAQLGPLLNPFGSTPDAVYRDLAPVAEKAWDLSSKILTSRLTFDFRFPEIGSRFSMQCMVPVWPLNDPTELQAQHWRVSLVTTPVITCRNDTGGSITAYSVGQADVMCMQ